MRHTHTRTQRGTCRLIAGRSAVLIMLSALVVESTMHRPKSPNPICHPFSDIPRTRRLWQHLSPQAGQRLRVFRMGAPVTPAPKRRLRRPHTLAQPAWTARTTGLFLKPETSTQDARSARASSLLAAGPRRCTSRLRATARRSVPSDHSDHLGVQLQLLAHEWRGWVNFVCPVPFPRGAPQTEVPCSQPRMAGLAQFVCVCDHCDGATAVVFCHSDGAFLCNRCDTEVHSNRVGVRGLSRSRIWAGPGGVGVVNCVLYRWGPDSTPLSLDQPCIAQSDHTSSCMQDADVHARNKKAGWGYWLATGG
jgi:hypothetical protein